MKKHVGKIYTYSVVFKNIYCDPKLGHHPPIQKPFCKSMIAFMARILAVSCLFVYVAGISGNDWAYSKGLYTLYIDTVSDL